jgi:hypothetical protein
MTTTPPASDSTGPAKTTTNTPVPAAPKKRVSRGTDIALTIVFLALQVALVIALVLPALFLAMASAGCGEGCNLGVIQAGFYVAVFGPGVVFIANLIVSIVFLVQKRTAWLLSLLGAVASLLVFLLGVALVFVQTG